MEEPTRARSLELRTPPLQVRVIKKLANIRVKFNRKSDEEGSGGGGGGGKRAGAGKGNGRGAVGPYCDRGSRSAENCKPFVSMSQPALNIDPVHRHSDEPTSSSSGDGSPTTINTPRSRSRLSWLVDRRGTSASAPNRDERATDLSSSTGTTSSTGHPEDTIVTEPRTMAAAAVASPILASMSPTHTPPVTPHIVVSDSGSRPRVVSESARQSSPGHLLSMSTQTVVNLTPAPTSSPGGRRSPAPRLATLPAPPTRFNLDGQARLSPSVISRRPAFPILNLPRISAINSPSASSSEAGPSRLRPQSGLRSMPALPREGPNEADQDATHDNATLADSDEEDEDETDDASHRENGSDDEEGDGEDISSRRDSTTRRREGLPEIDTSRFDVSFFGGSSTRQGDVTPVAPKSSDYFSQKHTWEPSPMSPARTPRPYEATPASKHQALIVPGSPRPSIYHQASRSMIDLLSPKQKEVGLLGKMEEAPPRSQAQKTPKTPQTPGSPSTSAASPLRLPDVLTPGGGTLKPSLGRRRSMPMFNLTTEPPPYPTFFPHPFANGAIIQPREEEGMETLPPYTNSIYLAAIMPRKMEFNAPGVQAKDRKWRRAYCVLEGTAFKVYKCPPGAAGVSALEEWWERKVGVGDVTNEKGSASGDGRIKIESVRARERERESKPGEERGVGGGGEGEREREQGERGPGQQVRSRSRQLAAQLLHPTRGTVGRSSMESTRESSGRSSLSLIRRSSMNNSLSGTSSSVTGGSGSSPSTCGSSSSPPPTSAPPGTSSFFRPTHLRTKSDQQQDKEKEKLPPPNPEDLIRAYTLQHAESGLGSDYVKRKNVIRVRMEGEQFLLQARDVAAVVEWIEGFQAATNIALDLDERPMPRGPLFPRRRRRRRPQPERLSSNPPAQQPSVGGAGEQTGGDPTGPS